MPLNILDVCVSPNISIRQATACIDRNRAGIVLITDDERHLIGTIRDGQKKQDT